MGGLGPLPVPKPAKFDRKGRIICPNCRRRFKVEIGKYRLARGLAFCEACKRAFSITNEVAIAVNEIWDRMLGTDPGLRREFIHDVEDNPVPDDELPPSAPAPGA